MQPFWYAYYLGKAISSQLHNMITEYFNVERFSFVMQWNLNFQFCWWLFVLNCLSHFKIRDSYVVVTGWDENEMISGVIKLI